MYACTVVLITERIELCLDNNQNSHFQYYYYSPLFIPLEIRIYAELMESIANVSSALVLKTPSEKPFY